MKLPVLKIGKLVAEVPIIQGGMAIRLSTARLAAAVAKEGGIGLIAASGMSFDELRINVNAVAPGFIKTDMTSVLSDKVVEGMLTSIPLHKLGETTDIAKAVVFLVSDDANYITGQTLHVDGGMVM